MAILSKGTDFTTGDQVTAAKLDALVDNATFASGAVDDSTTQLDGSGRIIVKDSGITSAKLNLSATGVSQTIASFKTTQDGNNRSLDILTPASTTDLNSPFELATGNAILFQIDPDHPILFDADGKVGIGTEGPDEQLTVQAGTFANNQDGGIAVQLGTESGSHFKTAFKCKTDGSGVPRTAIDAPNGSTGATQEVISIDNSGQVGIGTTDPSSILDITQATGAAEINLNATASDAILSLNSDTDEGQDSEIHFNAGTNTRGKIEYNHHETAANQKMSFFAGDNIERLTISGSGLVGIGQNTPTAALHIENTSEDQIILTNTSGNLSRIKSSRGLVLSSDFDDDSGGTQSFIAFDVDNSEIMRVIGSTGIAVGQTTTPTGVAGSIFCAGRIGSLDTVSQTTSDAANLFIGSDGLFKKSTSSARYKKNIEDYTKGIDALKLLRPVSFQSNNEEDGDKTGS